jgi:SulP family sulfate permease
MYKLGWEQFVPFVVTVVAILLTDLLTGITIGLVVSIFYTLRHSYRNAYHMNDEVSTEDGKQVHRIALAEEVTFFNKANIIKALDNIPSDSKVIIDAEKSKSIDYDVIELIKNFQTNAKQKNITVETINL